MQTSKSPNSNSKSISNGGLRSSQKPLAILDLDLMQSKKLTMRMDRFRGQENF